MRLGLESKETGRSRTVVIDEAGAQREEQQWPQEGRPRSGRAAGDLEAVMGPDQDTSRNAA